MFPNYKTVQNLLRTASLRAKNTETPSMSRRHPSRPRADYEFTASAGFDYNYDPVDAYSDRGFDPYANDSSSSPRRRRESPGQSRSYHYNDRHQWSGTDTETAWNRYRDSDRHQWSSTDPESSRNRRSPTPEYNRHQQNGTDTETTRDRYNDGHQWSGTDTESSRNRRSPIPEYNRQYRPYERDYQSTYQPQRDTAAEAIPIPASPSPEYTLEAHKPSENIQDPSSSRKLLILDLNGTLVYRSPHVRREFRPRQRQNRRNADQPPSSPQRQDADPYADPTAVRGLRAVHGRPYLASFREYIFHPSTREWLDTMVWSSAQPHSVADMVDKCFGERKDELVAVWARDTLGLEEKDYNRKAQTTKDLAKPWAALRLPLDSETPQEHSAHTTLLLDDSPLKAHLQPWNHLCIREYVAALRNADLACREAERTRAANLLARSSETSQDGQDVGAERKDVAVGETKDASTEVNEAGSGEKKKRKRKKKKNAAGESVSSLDDAEAPEGTYDQTLLAVVGILDHIKHESNVAGWMRKGGLRSARVLAEGNGAEKEVLPSPGLDVVESSILERHIDRKRRVSGEETIDDPDEVPGLSIGSTPAAAIDVGGIASPVNTGDSGQWFEDEPSMRFWVERGTRALNELGIEPVAGIGG